MNRQVEEEIINCYKDLKFTSGMVTLKNDNNIITENEYYIITTQDKNFIFWFNFFIMQWAFLRIDRKAYKVNNHTLRLGGYIINFYLMFPTFNYKKYLSFNRWNKW
jgi:hypothetical protein